MSMTVSTLNGQETDILSPADFWPDGSGIDSFCPACTCRVDSALGLLVGWSSSARMVSSLDSTPARKAPHLEAFCVVCGVDAIIFNLKALYYVAVSQ